jgi:hypothetical protein
MKDQTIINVQIENIQESVIMIETKENHQDILEEVEREVVPMKKNVIIKKSKKVHLDQEVEVKVEILNASLANMVSLTKMKVHQKDQVIKIQSNLENNLKSKKLNAK